MLNNISKKIFQIATSDEDVKTLKQGFLDARTQMAVAERDGDDLMIDVTKRDLDRFAELIHSEVSGPDGVDKIEFATTLCKMTHPHILKSFSDYYQAKSFAALGLAERKKFKVLGDDYDPKQAPERIRSTCEISLKNVKRGVAPELCRNIEGVPVDVAYKICNLLGAPGDTRPAPFVEKIAEKYGLNPEPEQKNEPSLG